VDDVAVRLTHLAMKLLCIAEENKRRAVLPDVRLGFEFDLIPRSQG
jgi:hypothetical protein